MLPLCHPLLPTGFLSPPAAHAPHHHTPPLAPQPAKKKKQKLKPAACNLSHEELLRMQKELFAGSRQILESEEGADVEGAS